MARLQLSVKGIDWAASLVARQQHEQMEGEWSAHQHLAHLLAVERQNFQPRIRRIMAEERPVLDRWDNDAFMASDYSTQPGIEDLAADFMAERATTVGLFNGLSPEAWHRIGVWPDGRIFDLAWLAEKVLWHALDHFAFLLDLHGELEPRQAPRWAAGS